MRHPRTWTLSALLLLSQLGNLPAVAGQSTAPANGNVFSAAATILNNVLGTPPASPTPSSPTTSSATPSPTPAATPRPTPAATPSPSPSPSPPPPPLQMAPPSQAPPPLPLNGNATALLARLNMQGVDLWPFTNAAALAVVQSLSQTLTTVTISGVNVINATQASTHSRRLLGANDSVDVYLELEGTSPAAALSINSDLGNSVLSGNLQRTMARNGLVLQSLSLTYSNAAVPETNVACNSGSYQGACISGLGGGLSTGAVIGIAVGGGVGALILIALCVTCTLKCAQRKQTARVAQRGPTKKAMTPQRAQPYWEQNQKEAARDMVSVSATPGSAEDGSGLSVPGTASGDVYAETKEMGGRIARDQLKMKLPAFAARTGRTTSGISRTTSAVSRQTSFAGSRTTSYVPGEGPTGMSEV